MPTLIDYFSNLIARLRPAQAKTTSSEAAATWLADWQVIHARWDHDEGNRYGQPLFASARTASGAPSPVSGNSEAFR